MADTGARTGLQLRSMARKEGIVELSLVSVPTPEPKPEEVIVRIDASPINPSDQGLLFAGADMSTAKASGTAHNPVVTASIPPAATKAMAGRLEQSLPVGNEGAGVVIQAGASPAAQALMGKTVAILGGSMYSQYRCISLRCHRRWKTGGANTHRHGDGGEQDGEVKEYSRYGSTTHKQVYIYGGLDRGPTEFNRAFGMAWGIGGWLLTSFLQKIGFEAAQKLRERVAAEIKTTFASTYTKE